MHGRGGGSQQLHMGLNGDSTMASMRLPCLSWPIAWYVCQRINSLPVGQIKVGHIRATDISWSLLALDSNPLTARLNPVTHHNINYRTGTTLPLLPIKRAPRFAL